MRKQRKLACLVLGIALCLTAAVLLCREVPRASSPAPLGAAAHTEHLPALFPIPEEQYSDSVVFYFQDFSGW